MAPVVQADAALPQPHTLRGDELPLSMGLQNGHVKWETEEDDQREGAAPSINGIGHDALADGIADTSFGSPEKGDPALCHA